METPELSKRLSVSLTTGLLPSGETRMVVQTAFGWMNPSGVALIIANSKTAG